MWRSAVERWVWRMRFEGIFHSSDGELWTKRLFTELGLSAYIAGQMYLFSEIQ